MVSGRTVHLSYSPYLHICNNYLITNNYYKYDYVMMTYTNYFLILKCLKSQLSLVFTVAKLLYM